MRLSCPSCQTEYDVPDAALAGRTRKLRCVQCGHQWRVPTVAEPPATAPLPIPPNAPVVETPIEVLAAEAEVLPETRIFGVPEDAEAERDVLEAAQHESAAAGEMTAADGPLPLPGYAGDAVDNSHREVLNMLVNASRVNAEEEKTAEKPSKFGKAWLLSILLVLIFVAYVFLGRDHIMHVWPASIRFYRALGLA